ncbi:hypothetical protein [Streptomyces paludis]|uniref:Uncharacterized protein n=1 Tax=Streptomyces paludis TaxID=2282738 RepID=A0A345HQE0_9ACTN|nr:hypothetical protein [Streptomyces paludis]AXG78914.1 hypothetical protein DVK44_15765 [Streptomyces paludis]
MADTAYAALTASADQFEQHGMRYQVTDATHAEAADVWTNRRFGLVLVLHRRKDGLVASEVFSGILAHK